MKHKKSFELENSGINWCRNCNVPLLDEKCGICREKGHKIKLSPPGDLRFCSRNERDTINNLMISLFGTNPIAGKLILLNKIPGEDKTDEIIVDGLIFGVLRFDMKQLRFMLDLRVEGAKALIDSGIGSKFVRISSKGGHLSGKTIKGEEILEHSDDIEIGDTVLVKSSSLTGFGISHRSSSELKKPGQSIRIRKIDSREIGFLPGTPSMEDLIRANASHMKKPVKDAVNTIRGIANQEEYRGSQVYVSFSGGKDSLAVLDLANNAVKKRIKAFFANTGIEFPETVEFVRKFCRENHIELLEVDAKEAFWENLPSFGPPAKDFRWCCKVCKLAPINKVMEGCTQGGRKCITIDGKRKYESFIRSRIAPKEENPFIPGQLNIFPIRNWRAIEVWLYIHYRGLKYNPLYDLGFERVGCWLCPAEFSAEYYMLRELHPELFARWHHYLLSWAEKHGADKPFIDHGFWRWKKLPPKMMKLARELGINTELESKKEDFSISVTGGISPCRTGGYTIEGSVTGILLSDVNDIASIIGESRFSQDMGVLLILSGTSRVRIFSSGHISVNAESRQEAASLFENTAKQLIRLVKCARCGVCMKACPADAIVLEPGLRVGNKCTRCGKCTESCVAVRYSDRFLPLIL
jgi:phosphoadenosine phosphosulfate reductase